MHASQKTICYYYHHLSTINPFFLLYIAYLADIVNEARLAPSM